jgi:hypothetical protein
MLECNTLGIQMGFSIPASLQTRLNIDALLFARVLDISETTWRECENVVCRADARDEGEITTRMLLVVARMYLE